MYIYVCINEHPKVHGLHWRRDRPDLHLMTHTKGLRVSCQGLLVLVAGNCSAAIAGVAWDRFLDMQSFAQTL